MKNTIESDNIENLQTCNHNILQIKNQLLLIQSYMQHKK